MSQNIENPEDLNAKEDLEENIMEHDYDGIKELNNPPPKWIMAIFFITIMFAIVYMLYYFVFSGPSQVEEYNVASAIHEEVYNNKNIEAAVMELKTDGASIAEGKVLFADMNCATCHGANGEGNAIGPNLTDNIWLNGCDFNSLFDVVKNGRPMKGMTAFKAQMTDEKIQNVVSYILGELNGSNPENAKEAQGTICE